MDSRHMHIKGLSESRTWRKSVSACIVALFLTLSLVGLSEAKSDEVNIWEINSSFSPESDSINQIDMEGLTKAVVRPDHLIITDQGAIDQPYPSNLVVMIPANMLSVDLAALAFAIKRDTELDTITALADYHLSNIYFNTNYSWDIPGFFTGRKETAQEMFAWVKYTGTLGGDCSGHASFNTAVLRMAGFSPEQVFSISITNGITSNEKGGHVVTLVNADGRWYVIDSTYSSLGRTITEDDTIYTFYEFENWRALMNDKYHADFNSGGNASRTNNMPLDLLERVVHGARPMMGYPQLGYSNIDYLGGAYYTVAGFARFARPVDQMVSMASPHSVSSCSSPEDLVAKNYEFINKTAAEHPDSQYMKALCARCPREERFYPVYANAARYGAWARHYGQELNMDDLEKTASNVFEMFKAFNNSCIVNETEVTYGDFPLIVKNGTSLDQAISAYGVMRNTNEAGDFVNPDKLYVLIDEAGNGFLAVDTSSKGWLCMDFCKKEITDDVPPSIVYYFNEKSGSTEWFEKSAPDTEEIGGNNSMPLILTLFLMLGISTILIYNFRTKKISKLLKRT